MFYMTQILTKNAKKTEKIEKSDIEKKITNLIIQLQISPIYFNRILDLFNKARNNHIFSHISKKVLLSICLYRLNLEEKLYISLRTIKYMLDIRTPGYLSNHLRLYEKFCTILGLKPIRYILNDHVKNICDLIGLGNEIEKKAINLVKMIENNFALPGEYRTCAITAIYFASNFGGELISLDQFDYYFDLISLSVMYEKIKIFTSYMKEFFIRKAQKKVLNNREIYFLKNFTITYRDDFFRKFQSIKN